MRSHSINKNEQNKDRIKSAVLSILIWSSILLFVFLYKLKPELNEQPEVITTMLVNFGDNRNGNGVEEPADQPGSLAAATEEVAPEPAETAVPETKTVIQPDPQPETKKTEAKEKVITGNNTKTSVPKKRSPKQKLKRLPQVPLQPKTLKNPVPQLQIPRLEMVTEKEMLPLEI